MSGWVFDATDQTFEHDVMERSQQVPVVVDFWAPWCGPCRVLGPMLERLVDEQNGALALAKVNIDENPELAGAFGVRSIPMVVGFRNGEVAAQFVGAIPESGARDFLAQLLPSEADELAAEGEAHAAAGASAEAEASFRRALDRDPHCAPALVGLATVLADRGDGAAAVELLDRVPPGSPVAQQAERLAATLRIRRAGGADVAALRAQLERNPDDLDARFLLAQAEAGAGRYDAALSHYLEIVRRNREFRDDAARKAMLDIFDVLGAGHELAERYRSDLARTLFR